VLEAGSGTKFLTISTNPTLWTHFGSHKELGGASCILYYDNVVNIPYRRTKERKGLITYYKTYVILIVFKKHVDPNHSIIVKRFEEEIDNEIIGNGEKQLAKKRPNVPTSVIFDFFCYKRTFQK
jgi:hypothetical protein